MSRRVVPLVVILLAAVATAAPAADAVPYATASAALRGAIRSAVAAQAPHAQLTNLDAACEMPVLPDEHAGCDGGFALRIHGRRTFYSVTSRATATRVSPASVRVALIARPESPRQAVRRGLPAQLATTRLQTGPVPPPQRTIHADVVIERDGSYAHRRLSRDRWLAVDVPFFFTQAFAEGPVTLHGSVTHTLTLPPGGRCQLNLGASAWLTAIAPREEPAGRLDQHPAFDDDPVGGGGVVIQSQATDPATGTITYIIAPPEGGSSSVVQVRPAPAGIGPPALRYLVVSAGVEQDLERFGAPTGDGYPPQDPLPAQTQACNAAAGALATQAAPALVASARIQPRAHPPKADPDDEGAFPVEPRGS